MAAQKKRVLVVDDSVFARKIVSDIIASSSELEVVGTAVNGKNGIELAKKLNPDVITLDVEMPELNGLDMLRQLMAEHPTPVVMLSSLTTRGAKESILALRLGAVDVMAKPHGTHSIGLTAQRSELIVKVLAAANANVKNLSPAPRTQVRVNTGSISFSPTRFPVVIIASSTGGPRALRSLVPGLTNAGGVAYVIVQHLPEGFSGPLARDLNELTDLNVREASNGDKLRSGDIIFAKAGYHLLFEKNGYVSLATSPPLWGVRPSADVAMISAIPVFGSRLIGVVLTGMGRDGADGVRAISEAGGVALAEHESSCVVYGMPRVAVESGCVDVVAPLQHMAEAINATVIKVAKSQQRKSAA